LPSVIGGISGNCQNGALLRPVAERSQRRQLNRFRRGEIERFKAASGHSESLIEPQRGRLIHAATGIGDKGKKALALAGLKAGMARLSAPQRDRLVDVFSASTMKPTRHSR
jgi:hypothetical protein